MKHYERRQLRKDAALASKGGMTNEEVCEKYGISSTNH